MKLSDSELKVMQELWNKDNLDEKEEIMATNLSKILTEKYGWPKTSNYVYFGRLLEKGVITRRYPKYTMKALIDKDSLTSNLAQTFIENTFGGSLISLFNTFLSDKKVTDQDLAKLRELIDSYEDNKKNQGER